MSDYVRFEVKHVSLSLPKKRPNISISPSLCSCEPDFSFSPKVNISFFLVCNVGAVNVGDSIEGMQFLEMVTDGGLGSRGGDGA